MGLIAIGYMFLIMLVSSSRFAALYFAVRLEHGGFWLFTAIFWFGVIAICALTIGLVNDLFISRRHEAEAEEEDEFVEDEIEEEAAVEEPEEYDGSPFCDVAYSQLPSTGTREEPPVVTEETDENHTLH
ncbi:MAG TPA: hypothetical protein QF873_03140 [Patescibacteria group bacterium]|nr:hypothetical protein [Patescibacteria group bacterium]